MASFAVFRVASQDKPMPPASARAAAEQVRYASAPTPFQLLQASRLLPQTPQTETAQPAVEVASLPADQPAAAFDAPLKSVPLVPAPAPSPLAPVPTFKEVEHHFQSGQTFSHVISSYGVSPEKAAEWIKAAQRVYSLTRIFPGQKLVLSIDTASQDLVSLTMEVDAQTNLVARRKDGAVVATREPVELGRHLRVVQGIIRGSFYASASRAGVPDEVISDCAEALGWDLNFENDIQPGANFSVAFEELERADATSRTPGQLLSVRIVNGGKTHEGIYFQSPSSKTGSYYARNGQTLGRDYLRFPVSFVRISSGFSQSRFHPVLKRARPHNGVDFAAPTGTPVYAVADGRVDMAEWHGGNGRYVKIRHDDVYESSYSHLSRIADGVRPGGEVSKGQVIGYVGSTGLSTGPHLHFSMYKNGEYIDPMSAVMPKAKSLDRVALERFRDTVTKIDAAYAAAERAGGTLAVASASNPRS
ncbi:MAG TPA: peptidoglycan DD-metalloendopeptidase family protein [Candidatus Binatia bacterium]|nr:peptidoglycan DD-metalloendopeptidase family protein [Candidatus Binatia bacterium]